MNVKSGDNQARKVLLIQEQTCTGVLTCDLTDPDTEFLPMLQLRPAQILLVSSDLENRRTLTVILNRDGWDTICVSRVSECREVLASQDIALVFCDRRLPDGTYQDVLAITRSLSRNVRLVVTSRLADWDEYLEALHHGAFDLIVSPCRPSDVVWTITQAKCEDEKRTALGTLRKARSASARQAAV